MMHNINDDDEEDDADVMPDFALLEEILSKSSLQAILEFIPKHNFDGLDSSAISADESTAFIAYTPADIDVITQTYNRLLHAENNSIVDEEVTIMDARNVSALEVTCEEDLIINLINDGIIRMNNVLSTDLCDELLLSINQKLAQDIANNVDMSRVTGYGNVLCRDNRWDLYLNVTDDVNSRVLCALFGDTSSNFGNFIRDLFNEGNDEEISVEFHEWSSLISEIGASSQPIHPDSQFTADCPMYTFFIALQDITNDMGGTIFLPNTNNFRCHQDHKSSVGSEKLLFLNSCEYKQALLKKGDMQIMDSRTLHFGDANIGGRRVLLYFTLRTKSFNMNKIPAGSKFDGMNMKISDFMTPESATKKISSTKGPSAGQTDIHMEETPTPCSHYSGTTE